MQSSHPRPFGKLPSIRSAHCSSIPSAHVPMRRSLRADDMAGGDISLDFRRALIDPHDPEIARISFPGDVPAEGLTAIDLPGKIGKAAGPPCGTETCHPPVP